MTEHDPGNDLPARIRRSIGENSPFGLLTIVQAKDSQAADRLAELLQAVAAPSRAELGNLLYTVSRGEDGLTFYLHDRWASLAAVARHEQSEHFRSSINEFGALTAPETADIHVLKIID